MLLNVTLYRTDGRCIAISGAICKVLLFLQELLKGIQGVLINIDSNLLLRFRLIFCSPNSFVWIGLATVCLER